MKDLVSIIVPVYKVEKYLSRCIESLIGQTYENVEIILVDDGSPDNCGAICDEYAIRDRRVVSYHIPNGGVSCARNYGLDKASGNYIFFLDSDDYIEQDCLAILISLLYTEGSDCVVCGAKTVNESTELQNVIIDESILQKKNFTQDEAVEALCYMQKPFPGIDMGAIWGCLFHKDVIQNERFDTKISIGEDFEFWFRILQNVKKITYVNAELYNYRIISSSAMRNGFNIKKYESVMRLAEIAETQQKNNIAFLSRSINIAIVVLLMIPRDEIYKEYEGKIEKYICSKRGIVLRDKKCRNKVRIALMLSYFGFSFMKAIFHTVKMVTMNFT